MSDMKCPMCNTNLEVLVGGANALLGCPRCRDKATDGVWQELIRTRKALDIAKKYLMEIGYLNMSEHGLGSERMMTDWCKTVALHALKEVETALEQKDK